MTKVAVVLSGCGVFDGSEIHESVLTLLALDEAGVERHCVAPNVSQAKVVNHLTQEQSDNETRNVLVESARIARGNIRDIAEVAATEFDAAIFPGGFGAVTNLCDFAEAQVACGIQQGVLAFAQAMAKVGKPMGFICIAPVMIPKIYGESVSLTIGNDAGTAAAVNAMGGQHVTCAVDGIHTDEQYRVVSTPAYMLAENVAQAAQGINKLVHQVLAMVK